MIITLRSESGLSARVCTRGACLMGLDVTNGSGITRDVTLGLADEASYRHNDKFFGAVVGRCVNRIAGASFELGGRTYALEANDGPNCNHSGSSRWHERTWDVVEQDGSHVTLGLLSPTGDQGFPGSVEARATYALRGDTLSLELEAHPSEPTIVNLTSHAYFNLNGHAAGSVLGHRLEVAASHYLPANEQILPTGELRDVAGTAFDFRHGRTLGEALPEGGYDICLVADGKGMRHVARLVGDQSGICMDVSSDQPGMQLYTANFLDGDQGKDGAVYQARDAVCLECAGFPDAIHHPEWPSVVVTPESPYRSRLELAFS